MRLQLDASRGEVEAVASALCTCWLSLLTLCSAHCTAATRRRGWGYDYGCYRDAGTSCRDRQELIDGSGARFTASACPVEDPHLASFYCGNNQMSRALDRGIRGRVTGTGSYLAAFVEFLEQEFLQACSLGGAVDQLMGQGGVLRDALIADTTHWRVRNFDIDREVRFMKGWINARLQFLLSSVNEACAENAECVRLTSQTSWTVDGQPVGEKRPQNCRFASETQVRALCAEAGILPTTPTVCKQSSMGPTCVIDPDPCASTPCQNGGECSSSIVPSQNAVDACGCAVMSGSGWSSSAGACTAGKSTSQSEARACIERQAVARGLSVEAETQRWLAYRCDCSGGWSGATCDTPGHVGPDACGCELGFGWSRSQAQCKPGGTTSEAEATACIASGDGGGGGGVATGGSCDMATLGGLATASCPAADAGALTPGSCPPACAQAMVPFWAHCSADQALAAELGEPMSAAIAGFVSAACGGAAGGLAPGGGH